MPKRILVGQFMHETNTFCRTPTDVDAFRRFFCHEGDSVLSDLRDTNSEVAGFIDVAEAEGWELVPTVACFATPSGPVTRAAWDHFAGTIVAAARERGPFDGILLSLHGAMVTEDDLDGEGALLAALREAAGSDVPMLATLDLHANVTDRMAALADGLVSYATFPHVDMRDTGAKAADILAAIFRSGRRPRVALARRPMLTAAEGGRTDTGPMVALLQQARSLETRDGVLDVSINAGFALADTPQTGPTVTVTSVGDAGEAAEIADTLMDVIWRARDRVMERYYTVDEAAALARTFDAAQGPLVIADFSDNPGDGAYGDATALLAALIEHGVTDAAFGGLHDEAAAHHLHEAGLGAEVSLSLGGRSDPSMGGGPLTLTGTVVHLSDGPFVCDGPMWKDMRQSTGRSAVFRVGGIDILVTSNLVQAIDRQMFVANGIDPLSKRVVALKSQQHFRAAFEPMAGKVILADSGGLASPDFARLPYRFVRRPLHPLDPSAND